MKIKLAILRIGISILLSGLVGLFFPVSRVYAATIVVDYEQDVEDIDGLCTLREAINNANNDDNSGSTDCAAGSGLDTITFSVGGLIPLAAELPAITDPDGLVIDGNGKDITIDGGSSGRVFLVESGGILTLEGVIVSNGYTDGNGAGVDNWGSLMVNNSSFIGNQAVHGGAVANEGTNGSLTITNSTFEYNIANGFGGAIYHDSAGSLLISNCTFRNNRGISGGAIYEHTSGSITPMTILNTTISGNTGGGIYAVGNSPVIKNTILSNNGSSGNCFGSISNGGNNIDSGTSCGFSSNNGSQSNTNPQLGTYSNGLFPLNPNSPAIDGVVYNAPNSCPEMDQRGMVRNDLACDIGSYELTLDDSHTVTKVISGSGTHTFGPTRVKLELTNPGSLTELTVLQVDSHHPHAPENLRTSYYWRLTPNSGADGFSTSLTLPAINFVPEAGRDKVCRSVSGNSWDCAANSYSATSITRQNVTAFSDWTLGEDAGPTIVKLSSFTAKKISGLQTTMKYLLLALIAGCILPWLVPILRKN